ncbi:hypothetical protein ACFRAO_39105 [Streptomyces sp. NPDC056656]|uniref:hypothetical protein n=1 Tax=Streptomyces sp. NPDC056656 TaxID=3345895 RepID=UPI0036B02FA6
MAGYKPYLPKHLHAAFDDSLELYAEHGLRSSDPEWLASRLDPDEVDKWRTDVVGEARLTGDSDPHARLVEMDRDGRAGEILFPDFGRPFELGTPIRESLAGYTRKPEHIAAGLPTHNRWLAEYVSVATERFGGMANVDFDNVEGAMAEIRWAREAGLRGVLLPTFDDDRPLFSPELGMDYPHHEGTWAAGPGTLAYLQATLGACEVPADEPRMLLSENAIRAWGVDGEALRTVADRIGPPMAEVLSSPRADLYPRGDVGKPLSSSFGGVGS